MRHGRVSAPVPINRGSSLDDARRAAGLGMGDLWMRYIALGGLNSQVELERFLRDEGDLAPNDHDVLVHALNERFMDCGEDHPIRYSEDP